MDKKDMALPTARATRASTEPASSLGHSASVANVFVVERHTGSFDDFLTTPIIAFLDSEAAEAAAQLALAEFTAAREAVPTRGYPPSQADEAIWEKWEADREADWAAFKAMLSVDPQAAPDGAWMEPDDPKYYVIAVRLAQAMSTGTAKTAQPVEGDSLPARSEGCALTPSERPTP